MSHTSWAPLPEPRPSGPPQALREPLPTTATRAASRGHTGGSHDAQEVSHAQDAAVPLGDEVSVDHRRWSTGRRPILRILQRRLWRLAAITLIGTVCAGCGNNVKPVATIRLNFLPVALSIGASGVSIEGIKSLATPIGTFSIGALYELPPRNPGSTYVILRDRHTGFDKIYKVQTGADQFMAVVNGTTSISITNGQVLIDTTGGTIKRITFKRVSDPISQRGKANWLAEAWHIAAIRWTLIVIIAFYILRRLLRGY
jgi:hypothetical protein